MPFDSFMTAALTAELQDSLCGLKVDRIFQPERDEIDLLFHRQGRNRLVISCSPAAPFMALSATNSENPQTPPMMCMLLRKHLSRAKIIEISQPNFDRVIRIQFDSGDELGFVKQRTLYCEMMGRGSNLVFVNENNVILTAFRQNDITTKFGRVVMNGMPYEPMPLQDKFSPRTCNSHTFFALCKEAIPEERCDQFLQKRFFGFGPLTAREVAYRTAGRTDAVMADIKFDTFWTVLQNLIFIIDQKKFCPCLIYQNKETFEQNGAPLDFSFLHPQQFSADFYIHPCESISEAIELFYLKRSKAERQKQHANDIAQILKHSKARLEKKILAQEEQITDAKSAEEDKQMGDLITQEIYRIKRGDRVIYATDYAKDPPEEVKITLDTRLSPAANAQKYYRSYAKKKTALVKVYEQIQIAKEELEYANSVIASLETATDQASIEQIRMELSQWNYGRRMSSVLKKSRQKIPKTAPLSLVSPNGYTVLVGRNNFQNDAVSFRLSDKDDLWFHVKAYHGSHVLLKTPSDKSIEDADISFAASLAAFYSEAKNSDRVEVDMTRARYLKKPSGAKPGFVTYKNQQTFIVTPKNA